MFAKNRFLVSLLLVGSSAASFAQFTTVALPSYNLRIQSLAGAAALFPEGNVTLGGVPFVIPVGGNNAFFMAGAGQTTFTVPTNIPSAAKVHILLNTGWGTTTPNLAQVETTVDGNTTTKFLTGGTDMRDYLQNTYTNTINGTTTTNVFNAGSGSGNAVRLDKLTITLPASGNLTQIRFVDNGANNVQRLVISGITVEAVPEPATLSLLGLGALALVRRRRAN